MCVYAADSGNSAAVTGLVPSLDTATEHRASVETIDADPLREAASLRAEDCSRTPAAAAAAAAEPTDRDRAMQLSSIDADPVAKIFSWLDRYVAACRQMLSSVCRYTNAEEASPSQRS